MQPFKGLDVRLGTILSAERLEGVRIAAYRLTIDFGPQLGSKTSAAQITDRYTAEGLIGKQVLAAVDLPPKTIGRFVSEVLVLGVADTEGKVVLVVPERPAPDGAKLF